MAAGSVVNPDMECINQMVEIVEIRGTDHPLAAGLHLD